MPPLDDAAPLRSIAKPGQGGVDGGGFQIVKESNEYLLVNFEALKKGFIDDLKLALVPGRGGVEVRSSSRVRYTDFGVNAIRLNAICASLREKGWKIGDITPTTHPDYWIASNEARVPSTRIRRKLDGGDGVAEIARASLVVKR